MANKASKRESEDKKPTAKTAAAKGKGKSKEKEEVLDQALEQQPKKSKRRFFKVLLVLFLILLLAIAAFAGGIYLKFIDMSVIADRLKLHDNPVIGKYFPPPKTNFETVELPEDNTMAQAPGILQPQPPQTLQPTVPVDPLTEQKKLDPAEILKQEKLRQQEEAKRISKLARLYGGMKPDEAVAIMNQLDDQTVLTIFAKMEEEQVSKIMALMEARRAAALTQGMMRAKPQAPVQ